MSHPYHIIVGGNGPQAHKILASVNDLDSAKRLARKVEASGAWKGAPVLLVKRMGPNGDGNHYNDEYHYNLAQG